MNGKEELIKKLNLHKYVHFIVRIEPDKNKPTVDVGGFLNNLNSFYKPGYEFKSMSLQEQDKREKFLKMLEDGEIEAFCLIEKIM